MKKISIVVVLGLIFVQMFVAATTVLAGKPIKVDSSGNKVAWSKSGCATIPSGLITDSVGNPIKVGYDIYGYNYQAHMFNGTYDSSDRNLDGTYWGLTADWVDDKLMMKWSDPWLANVDCNSDGKLDRGLIDGVSDGISKGWLTNHWVGDDDHDTEFVKIVWTGPGSSLWGQYSIIQEVFSSEGATKYATPGFGLNDHWTELP